MPDMISTMDLKPYPEYKESGVPWLGEIPEDWAVVRLKNVFREVDRRTTNGKEPLLRMSKTKGLMPYNEISQKPSSAKTLIGYKICEPNEIVMNKMQAWNGVFALATSRGLVSPEYTLLHPRFSANVHFFIHLLRTPLMVSRFFIESQGVGSGFLRLYTDRFGRIPVAIPSEEDQERCFQVINVFDQKINSYIRAKRRLIELLNEQKQAIISRAVTRGIDPNVRIKPSGVEWLGDVPEHWKVRRLRDVANLIVSNVDKHTIKGEIPIRLCNYNDVYKNEFVHSEMPFMQATASESEIIKFRIHKEDVLITKDSEEWQDIGVPAYVTSDAPDLICGYHLAIIRPDPSIMQGRYLHWQLMSHASRTQFSIRANGVTRYGLSHGAIKDVSLLVPTLTEQSSIVRFIDEATSDLNHTISDTNRVISLLQEYRTRLISDVITGKVDIRNIETKEISEPELEGSLEEAEFEPNSEINGSDNKETG